MCVGRREGGPRSPFRVRVGIRGRYCKKKKGVCGGEREKGATGISLRNDRVFTFPFFHSTIAAGRRFWPLRCRPHTKSEFQFVGRLRESGIIPTHSLFVCHLYWYLCILRPCACASNSCRSRDDLALGLQGRKRSRTGKGDRQPQPNSLPRREHEQEIRAKVARARDRWERGER